MDRAGIGLGLARAGGQFDRGNVEFLGGGGNRAGHAEDGVLEIGGEIREQDGALAPGLVVALLALPQAHLLVLHHALADTLDGDRDGADLVATLRPRDPHVRSAGGHAGQRHGEAADRLRHPETEQERDQQHRAEHAEAGNEDRAVDLLDDGVGGLLRLGQPKQPCRVADPDLPSSPDQLRASAAGHSHDFSAGGHQPALVKGLDRGLGLETACGVRAHEAVGADDIGVDAARSARDRRQDIVDEGGAHRDHECSRRGLAVRFGTPELLRQECPRFPAERGIWREIENSLLA